MTLPSEYAPAVMAMAEVRWELDCKLKDPLLTQLLWGQYAKGIGCPKCMMWVDVKPEVFNVLEVPLPSTSSKSRGNSFSCLQANLNRNVKIQRQF